MSQHIDDFFQSRKNDNQKCSNIPLKKPSIDSGLSSAVTSGAMINMVHQFRDTLDNGIEHQEKKKLCDDMLVWLQHEPLKDQLDEERRKNARLITSIKRLARRHHDSKQLHRQEIVKIRRHATERVEKEKQARQEAEEILDSVRVEMESMMDELDTAKQQLFMTRQETQHIRDQWENIIQQKKQHTNEEDDNTVDPWALLVLQQEDGKQRIGTLTTENHRLTELESRLQEQPKRINPRKK
ncbi:hypothetical protein BC941DRAFT_412044 [Chlamydoabsidia padenii]|nr:hypothetical protein BC941DRAFT_412044 [Chlamydoabsidia padenii]